LDAAWRLAIGEIELFSLLKAVTEVLIVVDSNDGRAKVGRKLALDRLID